MALFYHALISPLYHVFGRVSQKWSWEQKTILAHLYIKDQSPSLFDVYTSLDAVALEGKLALSDNQREDLSRIN